MKKLFLYATMCLMALSMNAQRCAVLEFKAGAGISQSDVDGISAIFITYFRPEGYTMVERTQIDKAIDEQGFQRSCMTESQMVRIGQILNVSKIVVGDVNVVMGQYNVDARVIDVESGTIAATEGATFTGASYRETMQNIAKKLASQIALTPSNNTSHSAVAKTRSQVEIVYGYLKIFPHELGTFTNIPSSVIDKINSQAQYGYNNWRIPKNEEISLMRANGYLSTGEYMSEENPKGILLLVTSGDDYTTVKKKEQEYIQDKYVDLGLPSGTLWAKDNISDFINQEMCLFWATTLLPARTFATGENVPTIKQMQELETYCTWEWIDSNVEYGAKYKIIGRNGNYIILPAMGYKDCEGHRQAPYGSCYYWASDMTSDTENMEYFRNKSVRDDPCPGWNFYKYRTRPLRLVFNPR